MLGVEPTLGAGRMCALFTELLARWLHHLRGYRTISGENGRYYIVSPPPGVIPTCYSASDRWAEYYDERVCLSVCVSVCVFVCPRSYLRNYTSDLHQILCYLWPWFGPLLAALCTSGFTDYVTFAHKPRLFDVAAQLKRSAHAALGLAINCAQ